MSLQQIPGPEGLHIQLGDATALGVVFGSLVGWLPAIAALLSIIWTGLRIYEMPTTQKLLDKFWRKEPK